MRGCDMATEKSLLQKIREKELEMSVKIDEARREADQNLARAKKESAAILNKSEEEARRSAEEYLKREMDKIRTEADIVRTQSGDEVRRARETGEKNLQKAVDRIVSIVLAE
jgi:vacuolar-type H+-ATPase subunit H